MKCRANATKYLRAVAGNLPTPVNAGLAALIFSG